jgi:hypothetical protein
MTKQAVVKWFTVLALSTFAVCLHAQKKHFVFIQAENNQPFHVILNSNHYTSTSSGYLVIPKLRNGRYFIIANLPADSSSEQKFTFVIDEKDLGFSLKRNNGQWALYDLVSQNAIVANPPDWEATKAIADTIKNIEPPTLVTEAHPSSDTITTTPVPVKTDTAVVAVSTNTSPDKTDGNNSSNKNTIVKVSEKANSAGIDQVYIDYSYSTPDTISIFIPAVLTTSTYTQPAQPTVAVQPTVDTAIAIMPGKASQYNRNCVTLATEVDYDRTRRQMSEEVTDDKMIQVAKYSLRERCFSVDQIQHLGLLFVSEQSRLKFFVAAKPNIYDLLNYPSLERQFTLTSVIEQFKKSVR